MKIQPFALERYFAKHEFTAKHLLSSSDCQPLSLLELVEMAHEDRIELWIDLQLGYTESQGHPRLRDEIAQTYSTVTADELLVIVPEEGIFLLMHALLEPGDHVISTFPGYQSLYEIARSIGCDLTLWEPAESDGWQFDPDDLRKAIKANTRLVVANFPHNPTGYVPSVEEFRKIVEIVAESGIHLLSDEMYRSLELNGRDTLPAGCDLYAKAISLSGLSKSYGLPGLRIGWTATHDGNLLQRMMGLKDYTTICASAPSEILAIFALANRKIIVDQQKERLQNNLIYLDRFMNEFSEYFSLNRPSGGSICFPRIHVPDGATRFCETLVQEAGIMLAPSTVFEYGDDHVRIGFGRDSLREVLDLFGVYLKAKLY